MTPDLPPTALRPLGRTGLTVTWVGFGTYRVDDHTDEHRDALQKYLDRGGNLIDTSTNYGDGGSERAVGRVLAERGREGVVVVSKAGYVQGTNLEMARERETAGDPFPEMVKYAGDCWHCIHPRYLETQLGISLDRLRMPSLDVYLLHNPEYFFAEALNQGEGSLGERRAEFYGRIRAAFAHLEEEVARGRIRHYGVSSNTFGLGPDHAEFTDLTEMEAIARSLAGDGHHFSVVQLPANLLETGPFDGGAIRAAADRDLGVLVNRPLNAIQGNVLYRLADFPVPAGGGDLADRLNRVAELEESFVETLGGTLRFRNPNFSARDLFRWGVELGGDRTERFSPDEWTYLESRVILPQTHQLLDSLTPVFSGVQQQAWEDWQRKYLKELGALLAAIRSRCHRKSREMVDRLREEMEPRLPETWRGQSFSRQAIAAVGAYPGVSAVLNGMRRKSYVDDSLGVLELPPLPYFE